CYGTRYNEIRAPWRVRLRCCLRSGGEAGRKLAPVAAGPEPRTNHRCRACWDQLEVLAAPGARTRIPQPCTHQRHDLRPVPGVAQDDCARGEYHPAHYASDGEAPRARGRPSKELITWPPARSARAAPDTRTLRMSRCICGVNGWASWRSIRHTGFMRSATRR